MCFELYGLAIATPDRYGWFLDSVVAQWLDLIEGQLRKMSGPHAATPAAATLILALFRGLHLDVIATDDVERVDAAFELAVSTLLTNMDPS